MITCPLVEKHRIRGHYNLATPFYRLFWGPHIHHGYWEGTESPRSAQLQLTDRLAAYAQIQPGNSLLDVGCGMGASSIHLARSRDCRTLGITISPLQCYWAALSARCLGAGRQAKFLCADAEQFSSPPHSFDVVWSIECTEHLFDKPGFFARAARWLKPGGRMAICAWLAADSLDDSQRRQLYEVCEGFLCPSLGTSQNYAQWMADAGLQVNRVEIWTERVAKTWEICRQRVARSRIRRLAAILDRDAALFLDRFDTILSAYRTGAMKYGCFIAQQGT
jgi:tocopherol O-methyltransferase